MSEYPLVWTGRREVFGPSTGRGEPCRILARGRMNSILIEFKDGGGAVVSGNGLRRAEKWRSMARLVFNDFRRIRSVARGGKTDTKFSGERKANAPGLRGRIKAKVGDFYRVGTAGRRRAAAIERARG